MKLVCQIDRNDNVLIKSNFNKDSNNILNSIKNISSAELKNKTNINNISALNTINSMNNINPSFCNIIHLLIFNYLHPLYCCHTNKKTMFSLLVSSFTEKLNIDEFIKNHTINKKIAKILFTDEQIELILKEFNEEKLLFDNDIINILKTEKKNSINS